MISQVQQNKLLIASRVDFEHGVLPVSHLLSFRNGGLTAQLHNAVKASDDTPAGGSPIKALQRLKLRS